jgi:PAS domain S-box-containing protein
MVPQNDLLSLIIDQTDLLIYNYDVQNNKIEWKGNVEGIIGNLAIDFQRFTVEDWETAIHEEDREHAINLLKECEKNKKRYTVIYRFRHSSGNYNYIQDTGTFTYKENGEAHRMYGVMKNINYEYGLQQTLKETETRYKSIFEKVNDAILIFDPITEKILEVNRKACILYGFEEEEFLQLTLKDLTKNIEKGEDEIRQIIVQGRRNNFETIHFTKDRREINLLVSSSYMRLNEQSVIISVINDVTEKKMFENKIVSQNEKLKEIAVIQSHELRRPVANILGLTNIICNHKVNIDEENIKMLQHAVEELEVIINKIIEKTIDVEELIQ